jgi:AraC-like DNA-binding protein
MESNDPIGEFLRQHRPYLKQGYRLTHMSRELGIPRHILSRRINEQYGMNFNALINLFRVEYLLELPQHDPRWPLYTMEALGRLAGFHCRNTLTKAFQKCTGESPSHYFLRISQQPADPASPISFSRHDRGMMN